MRKLGKILLGQVLVVAATDSTPRTASAANWCTLCVDNQ